MLNRVALAFFLAGIAIIVGYFALAGHDNRPSPLGGRDSLVSPSSPQERPQTCRGEFPPPGPLYNVAHFEGREPTDLFDLYEVGQRAPFDVKPVVLSFVDYEDAGYGLCDSTQLSGVVIIDVVVDATGTVVTACVRRSVSDCADSLALECAMKTTFTPAQVGDGGVAAVVSLPFVGQ